MSQSIVATLIALFTFLVTYQAEKDAEYKENYIFWTDGILIHREWYRLFSSGFIHSGWWHFGFNMFALLGFSYSLERVFGLGYFALVYFVSLVGGSLLALYVHRNHGDYRALGASGAVSGVIMASVVLFPTSEIGFVLLPIGMPSWLFGAAFILISIFGIKTQAGNIGHEAHLGGAIVGALFACALEPAAAVANWWVVLLILLPCAAFLYLIVRQPEVLMIESYWGSEVEALRRPRRPKAPRQKAATLDELLDKIRTGGIDSLSKRERQLLEEYQRGMK